jgi:choline dehydrogenase-like flavoprotein
MEKEFAKMAAKLESTNAIDRNCWKVSKAIIDLIGDHQMSTCRMGKSAESSVIDPQCRVWDAPNVFVVDASFMPTGLGLNPMITVVANALRVGSWMIQNLDQGKDLTA